MDDNKDQKENEDQKDKSNSLVSKLVVPILIALIAGGTSPWWVIFFEVMERKVKQLHHQRPMV
jgi:flagellar basal body-associated protein FliL